MSRKPLNLVHLVSWELPEPEGLMVVETLAALDRVGIPQRIWLVPDADDSETGSLGPSARHGESMAGILLRVGLEFRDLPEDPAPGVMKPLLGRITRGHVLHSHGPQVEPVAARFARAVGLPWLRTVLPGAPAAGAGFADGAVARWARDLDRDGRDDSDLSPDDGPSGETVFLVPPTLTGDGLSLDPPPGRDPRAAVGAGPGDFVVGVWPAVQAPGTDPNVFCYPMAGGWHDRGSLGDLDLLLLPSGSPGAEELILAAVHHGIPVVAARWPGSEALLGTLERAGLPVLHPPGDLAGLEAAVGSLVRDPDLRSRIRAGLKEVARRFEPSKQVSGLLSAYLTLAPDAQPPALAGV